jgi:nitroreductase
MSDEGRSVSDSFFDIVARQRACRSFSEEPVDDETIARILTAATFAPSAENKQPWEFVVVRDRETRAAIGDLSRRAWEAHGRAFSETRLTPAMLAEVDRGATGGVAEAPVNIVVCADVERGLEVTIPSSIFPATQNLLLAATALGLGSALTTIATGFRAEMQTILGLPDHVRPIAVVPLGHPARPLGPPRRAPFAERTHRERFGRTW